MVESGTRIILHTRRGRLRSTSEETRLAQRALWMLHFTTLKVSMEGEGKRIDSRSFESTINDKVATITSNGIHIMSMFEIICGRVRMEQELDRHSKES